MGMYFSDLQNLLTKNRHSDSHDYINIVFGLLHYFFSVFVRHWMFGQYGARN